MKSFLEDLYHGRIFPAEYPCPLSPELRKKQLKNDDAFEAKLKAADPKLVNDFSAWLDIEGEVSGATDKQMFLHGFRLGVQMMLEVLSQS